MNKAPKKTKKTKKDLEQAAAVYNAIISNDLAAIKRTPPSVLMSVKLTDYEYNPLHLAVAYNAKDIVNYILNDHELKGLVNMKDANGDTPLHTAVFTSNLEGYQAIRDSGVYNAENQTKDPLDLIHEPAAWKAFLEKMCEKYHDQKALDLLHSIPEPHEPVFSTPNKNDHSEKIEVIIPKHEISSQLYNIESKRIESNRNSVVDIPNSKYEDIVHPEEYQTPSTQKINSSLTESGKGVTAKKYSPQKRRIIFS